MCDGVIERETCVWSCDKTRSMCARREQGHSLLTQNSWFPRHRCGGSTKQWVGRWVQEAAAGAWGLAARLGGVVVREAGSQALLDLPAPVQQVFAKKSLLGKEGMEVAVHRGVRQGEEKASRGLRHRQWCSPTLKPGICMRPRSLWLPVGQVRRGGGTKLSRIPSALHLQQNQLPHDERLELTRLH